MSPVRTLEWCAPRGAADIRAWVDLLAVVEAADRTGEVLVADDITEMMALSYFDRERTARLLWTSGGELVAFGDVLQIPSKEQRRVVLEGAVHPRWHGRGIGTALIEWLIDHGREVAMSGDGNLDGWLEVSSGDGDSVRSALFRSVGFVPRRYFYGMRRVLGELVATPVPVHGVTIEPFTFERDEAVRIAHNAAFREHWGSTELDRETWNALVTGHHAFAVDASFVAVADDEVVGYALSSIHPPDWEVLGFSEGWTDQLGTVQPWRRRGIATGLLASTMHAFSEMGLERAALDVDSENATGALSLYEGLGYKRGHCRVAWSRGLP